MSLEVQLAKSSPFALRRAAHRRVVVVTSESDVFVVQRNIIRRIIHRTDDAHRRRDARRDRVCGDANDVDRVVAREADAAGG